MLRAQRNANVASGLVSGTEAVASSGFLKSYGNYLGGTLSLLWVGLAIYSAYYITNLNTQSAKSYYWTGPGILGFLVLIANGYYMLNKNKGDDQAKQSVKSTYANITLSPFYLIMIGLALAIVLSIK